MMDMVILPGENASDDEQLMICSESSQVSPKNAREPNSHLLNNNRDQSATDLPDFVPAYYDTETGQVYLSRYSNGTVAAVHVLDGIPSDLLQYDDAHNSELSGQVIIGFVFNNKFYTRGEALEALNKQNV